MERNIARMITLLARKSQIYIGSALSKYNITASEQPFFMALQKHEGITQEELTAIVCVDKAVTTRVVKSLEKKGYLRRVKDIQDRRRNLIYPTDITKKLGKAVKDELLYFNDLLVQNIDEKHIEIIYMALHQMEYNFLNIKVNTEQRRV